MREASRMILLGAPLSQGVLVYILPDMRVEHEMQTALFAASGVW